MKNQPYLVFENEQISKVAAPLRYLMRKTINLKLERAACSDEGAQQRLDPRIEDLEYAQAVLLTQTDPKIQTAFYYHNVKFSDENDKPYDYIDFAREMNEVDKLRAGVPNRARAVFDKKYQQAKTLIKEAKKGGHSAELMKLVVDTITNQLHKDPKRIKKIVALARKVAAEQNVAATDNFKTLFPKKDIKNSFSKEKFYLYCAALEWIECNVERALGHDGPCPDEPAQEPAADKKSARSRFSIGSLTARAQDAVRQNVKVVKEHVAQKKSWFQKILSGFPNLKISLRRFFTLNEMRRSKTETAPLSTRLTSCFNPAALQKIAIKTVTSVALLAAIANNELQHNSSQAEHISLAPTAKIVPPPSSAMLKDFVRTQSQYLTAQEVFKTLMQTGQLSAQQKQLVQAAQSGQKWALRDVGIAIFNGQIETDTVLPDLDKVEFSKNLVGAIADAGDEWSQVNLAYMNWTAGTNLQQVYNTLSSGKMWYVPEGENQEKSRVDILKQLKSNAVYAADYPRFQAA